MIKIFRAQTLGRSNLGWLESWFHFSFADYHDLARIQFGALRVINDDLIQAGKGFDTHGHRDMEIISYVIDGSLTHSDSMGNQRTLTRGQVQYMSAGTGVRHSEYNRGNTPSRLLQMWILPDRSGYAPRYGDHEFEWAARENRWLHLVSPDTGTAPVKIHQDANFYATSLSPGSRTIFEVRPDRQAYLVLIEGTAQINGETLAMRDGLESVGTSLDIASPAGAHLLVIEMAAAN
ncbi:MAG: pirin protein [Proteobacteria bacterium]|nr:pirin protein [Pseudomonadota bacterium]